MSASNSSVLRLRPHHLLCLQTFVGHGYSEEFVRHMTLVKNRLTADPHTPIVLVKGADELCAHCPNCVDGQCTSENPALFDRLVSERLTGGPQTDEQQTGERLTAQAAPAPLSGIPDSLQINEALLDACCPGCEWKELCIKVCRQRIKRPLR